MTSLRDGGGDGGGGADGGGGDRGCEGGGVEAVWVAETADAATVTVFAVHAHMLIATDAC